MNVTLALLNLGCGERIAPNWINVDLHPNTANVIPFDLNQGIPFPDSVFDVVYHSHLLEHFSKEYASVFLNECYRVLKPGGVIRVATPNLETIARSYLILLEKSLKEDQEAQKCYERIMLELFDKMVQDNACRIKQNYRQLNPIAADDFIIDDPASETHSSIDRFRVNSNNRIHLSDNPSPSLDPLKVRQFRLAGEVHYWMYDRYSLRKLLQEVGFKDIQVCRAGESRISGFNNYSLDTEANNSSQKTDSLFMEAIKIRATNDSERSDDSNLQAHVYRNMTVHKRKIYPNNIEWIGVRFLDTLSRTFRYNSTYYKAIFPIHESYILKLYRDGIFDHLFSNSLVAETSISQYSTDSFDLILEQKTEFFNISSQFWNPFMLRDAALTFIELNKYLLSHNLITKDGHTSNIIFQNNSIPKWCDIGSIVPGNNESMNGIREFIQYYVYPLMVREKSTSLSRISRYFTSNGCTEEEASQILNQNIRYNSGRRQVLDDLNKIINNVEIKFDKTTWSDYHGNLSHKNLDLFEKKKGASSVNRNEIVKRLLRTFKPKTILDIGANAGMFSILAAQSGAEVLALEPDESASTKCYQNFRECTGLKVKVSMDSFGSKTTQAADLVIGMALTHHLFFTHKYRLEIIAKILSQYTNNILVTEFMPNGMGGHVPKPNPLPENYRLELLLNELSKYFATVETIEPLRSANSSHRIIILCHEKKLDSL